MLCPLLQDLVKLQFGEYVSLGKVEAELKTCALVENICVYGSSFHTYLVALVLPNELALSQIADQLGKTSRLVAELCNDSDIVQAATELVIAHAKKCHLQKVETPIKVFTLSKHTSLVYIQVELGWFFGIDFFSASENQVLCVPVCNKA